MKNFRSITLTCIVFFGLTAGPAQLQAQGIKFLESSFNPTLEPAFPSMKQNVYAIDSLADKMTFRYGWEYRRNSDCRACLTLYNQMKRHAELTNELIRTLKGDNAADFRRAVRSVSNSVASLRQLRGSMKVSASVGTMIDQSTPFADYVVRNAVKFQPMATIGKGSDQT